MLDIVVKVLTWYRGEKSLFAKAKKTFTSYYTHEFDCGILNFQMIKMKKNNLTDRRHWILHAAPSTQTNDILAV